MKIYEIYDEENDLSVGTLLYYEKERTFIVELIDGLDEWTCPFLFSALVKRGITTIPREISQLWVRARIIPPSRQNINSILNTHKLKEYDEMTFLKLSNGRCSQDSLCIKKLDRLPDYVQYRQNKNLRECCALPHHKLLCIFCDDSVKKVDISTLEGVEKIMHNDLLYNSCKIGTGGYFATFDDAIDIAARELYQVGIDILLSPDELITFYKKNIMDTSECSQLIGCTRQNLSYMSRHEMITPIKENAKGNLYLRGDIEKNLW